MESLGFFVDLIISALGSTQSLTKVSTRNITWGKGGRCLGLTTLSLSFADCLVIWEPHPTGTLRVCPGLYMDCSTLVDIHVFVHRG